jgi:hypothetical protein
MEFLKNPYIAIILVFICIIFYYVANTGRVFGKFINKFFPCEQNPVNSMPCFGHYDIAVMIISFVVGVIFFSILVVDLYKMFRT